VACAVNVHVPAPAKLTTPPDTVQVLVLDVTDLVVLSPL
jgi:hypothetical protein